MFAHFELCRENLVDKAECFGTPRKVRGERHVMVVVRVAIRVCKMAGSNYISYQGNWKRLRMH